jgi:transposase
MPAKFMWPYSKGQKNDFRDAEAIAEAVQRPTMKLTVSSLWRYQGLAGPPGMLRSFIRTSLYLSITVSSL